MSEYDVPPCAYCGSDDVSWVECPKLECDTLSGFDDSEEPGVCSTCLGEGGWYECNRCLPDIPS